MLVISGLLQTQTQLQSSSGGVVALTATTASTSKHNWCLDGCWWCWYCADLGIGDDLCMISDGSMFTLVLIQKLP